MAGSKEAADPDWLAIIGRALAFMCLDAAELREESLAKQADFLTALGLPNREAARMLGTSQESLRVLAHRARKAKGGRHATKKPKKNEINRSKR